MSTGEQRLVFGAQKYAALSLIMARWLRLCSSNKTSFDYVTLGGTEFHDAMVFNWIDRRLLPTIVSYELQSSRYALALETMDRVRQRGINITVERDNIFEYQRKHNQPHIFFVDLEGVCKPKPFAGHFKKWLEAETLQPGDLLLITSFIGRENWAKVLEPFDVAFNMLGVVSLKDKRTLYRAAHPLFVLYRALLDSGFVQEISLKCIGYIKYHDNCTMGLFGIAVSEGPTELGSLVKDFPVFDMTDKNRNWDHVIFPV